MKYVWLFLEKNNGPFGGISEIDYLIISLYIILAGKAKNYRI